VTSDERSRWRPTRGEIVFLGCAGVVALVTALVGSSVAYDDGSVQLFRTPVWLLILVGAAGIYALRVRFRTRTEVDDRSQDFFDRE
jgi:hypothetical protein